LTVAVRGEQKATLDKPFFVFFSDQSKRRATETEANAIATRTEQSIALLS
jgi:hypothetical protein